jgi:hypothetical protein
LIDNGFHARRCGRKVLCREASRVIGHLAGKSDDAILGGDVDRGRFKERLGIQFGFDAGGDSVVARLVAGESKEQ